MNEEFGLRPAASLPALCKAMIKHGSDWGHDEVRIEIDISLLADSYIKVPGMFARNLLLSSPFPVVQSFIRKEVLVVRAGFEKQPVSFRAKVLAGILENGKYMARKELVPAAYRRRPSVLGRVLSEATGLTVCNDCNSEKIRWFVSEKN